MSSVIKKRHKEALLHPSALTLLVLLIQVVVLLGGYILLRDYLRYLTAFWYGLAVLLVIYVVNRQQNPAYKIAWLIPMCLMPIFGALLFLFIQFVPGTRHVAEQVKQRVRATATFLPQNLRVLERFKGEDQRFGGLADYLFKQGTYPVYAQTTPTYYHLGEEAFEAIMADIEKAERYIFLEFFIVSPGVLWDRLFEALARKAGAGVTVRFMYDGTNVFSLPPDFQETITEAGIECRVFAPVRPLLSTYQNNRDHRKILVVDGCVAYTGGINLADEYINAKVRFGHWKDTAIRLEGDAVLTMTALFLQSWHVHEEDPADYGRWLSAPAPPQAPSSQTWVVPYADAPADGALIAEEVYLDIINLATDYVYIMSPYLILDYETERALQYAARRGVDVRILLPHVPDKKIPFYIARSFYPALLQHGVRIYEYTPGFCHAKVMVSDKRVATVGTVNLDYRSLYLHFENGVFVYNQAFAETVTSDVFATLAKAREIQSFDYLKYPAWERGVGRVMRVFGPLM